ncbi:hypothetical protein FACS1894137_17560 [Spirochaetia bacterium]|nr:hypothetical protein FACS1894137_17560 [Spirochaetia bacterium]
MRFKIGLYRLPPKPITERQKRLYDEAMIIDAEMIKAVQTDPATGREVPDLDRIFYIQNNRKAVVDEYFKAGGERPFDMNPLVAEIALRKMPPPRPEDYGLPPDYDQ